MFLEHRTYAVDPISVMDGGLEQKCTVQGEMQARDLWGGESPQDEVQNCWCQ